MNHRGYQRDLLTVIGSGLLLLLILGCNAQPSGTVTSTAAPDKIAPAPNVLLVNYFSESGMFEVWLPTTQSIHDNVILHATLDVSMVCHLLWSKDYGAVWLVQYCDYPQEVMTKFTTQEVLDASRDQLLQNDHVQLLEEQDISFNHLYPGRSITAAIDGVYKARLYLAGNRVYYIAAKVYRENWGDRMSMIDAFLASLYIEGG